MTSVLDTFVVGNCFIDRLSNINMEYRLLEKCWRSVVKLRRALNQVSPIVDRNSVSGFSVMVGGEVEWSVYKNGWVGELNPLAVRHQIFVQCDLLRILRWLDDMVRGREGLVRIGSVVFQPKAAVSNIQS